MQQDELAALIDKTATLMAQYERRSRQIEVHLSALSERLQGLTQQLPVEVRSATHNLLRNLPGEMSRKMREGLDGSIDDYRRNLRTAGGEVERASQKMAVQIDQLKRLHRRLIWKTTGAAVLAFGILLGGGAWLSMHYTQVIRENQLTAEQMKAYNGADLVLCGDHALCANVDIRGQRYGEHRQYLPVQAR